MTAQDAYWIVRRELLGTGDVRVRVIDHVDGGWAIHITARLDNHAEAGGIYVTDDMTPRELARLTRWIAARIRLARVNDATVRAGAAAARAAARFAQALHTQLPPAPPAGGARFN